MATVSTTATVAAVGATVAYTIIIAIATTAAVTDAATPAQQTPPPQGRIMQDGQRWGAWRFGGWTAHLVQITHHIPAA